MKLWPCLLAAVVALVPVKVQAQVKPDKALSTFTVPDGLELSLWASEPLFVNPTCMDIDHKGRVWVCESVNYRNKLRGKKTFTRPAGDRIVILEDTRGTGKADRAITFYQSPKLLAPLGIAVAKDPVGPGYKVFVCQSPDILVFEDRDGDGKADGEPKKLLTGFGGFDHDHGVHGILIGPDMRLYFSVGDTGVHGLQSSDGKGRKWQSNSTDCRAGTIWRCDLDGKNLELIAHNFRNEYEPCVDSFGTVFVSDNDDDGNQQTRICYVMPGGNYGYHPRGPGQTHWHEEQPGVVPKILRTYFGSPTGMCVYEGTLLPKKYWGQLLHTDAGPRQLRCYHLKPKGAGYDVEREDMVTSTDNWFRPSDVCVAPDGSVFIADWYDPGVGGHGMGDIQRGRIYRLAPKGKKYRVPRVDLKSDKGILSALGSPNRAVRYVAMETIRSHGVKKFAETIQLVTPEKVEPRLVARLFALSNDLLKNYSTIEPSTRKRVMKWREKVIWHADPRLRVMWYRAVQANLASMAVKGPAAALAHYAKAVFVQPYAKGWMTSDKDLAVCREILLTARLAPAEAAKKYILELAALYDGRDRFYLEAIGIAVGHHDKKRRDIILADFAKQFPEWNAKVADLVWELRPPSMMPLLEKRLADAKLSAADRARIIDILATSDDKDAGKSLLKVLQADVPQDVRDKVVENLKLFLPGKWRGLRNSPELNQAIDRLMAKAESRPTGLALIGVAEKTDAVGRVTALARDDKQPAAVRQAAIRTLGVLPSVESARALAGLLGGVAPALRGEVVQALGHLAQLRGKRPGTAEALKALQDVVANDKAALPLRLAAVSALAGSRPGTTWLLDLHAKKKLAAALKPDTARLLRNSVYPDLRNRAMIAFPPPGKIDPKNLPKIAALLAHRGNAARGKQLMAASLKNDMQCLKCHTIHGVGGQVGPDLSMIGKKASAENLFESILNPSKAVADQFIQWQIVTAKGETLSGLIVEETPTHVTLRDGNGKDTKVAKKNIETRSKSPKSLMPEDIVVYMTEDDLVDAVAYLATLKTPALGMDYFHIAGPFDSGDGDAGMDKVFPPEKGIDRKAEYKGKSGTVRWRKVRPDAQGYFDLMAYFAPNSRQIVSYLYRDVESPAEQEATLLLGADDCCKVWVNGKLVHDTRDHAAATPSQYTRKVKLRKGSNRILVKINNGDGPHGLYFTLLSEQELKRVEEK